MTVAPDHLPQSREELVVRPRTTRKLLLGIFLLLLAALSLVALLARWGEHSAARIRNVNVYLFLGALLFFGGAVYTLLQALPSACRLRLTSSGMEVRTFFRSQHYAWDQVSRFRAGLLGDSALNRTPYLAFDLAPGAPARCGVRHALRPDLVQGGNALLVEHFGMTSADLAELLNTWHAHHRREVRSS